MKGRWKQRLFYKEVNIMKKTFYIEGKLNTVTLTKDKYNYVVKVNGEVYKKTPNLLFAVQVFNAI